MEELQKLGEDRPAPQVEQNNLNPGEEVRKIIHNKRIDNGALQNNHRAQDL
jgi:hypothetical protein